VEVAGGVVEDLWNWHREGRDDGTSLRLPKRFRTAVTVVSERKALGMKVKRIVADVDATDPAAAKRFYKDILGLDVLMDMGWIATYGSQESMSVQISFMSEGGSGAPVPDLSIEVDDLDAAIARVKKANLLIEYGPTSEPWGVRRFFVRDPFGKLLNILVHDR
jgi:catechol 2,3-dioxygenase-like lactoylglutathione lyase family enzyme